MASTACLMPRPRNRDTPQFEGKRIKHFLEEFEALTDAAMLSKDEHCHYIVCYCKSEAEEFIELLEEYEDNDWDTLKKKCTCPRKKKDIIPANHYCCFTVNPE
jgi:hypothetical protein